MIEGKLEQERRDPRNTQAVLNMTEQGMTSVALRDLGGVFLEVEPYKEVWSDEASRSETDVVSEKENVEELKLALREERNALTKEKEKSVVLGEEIEEQKGRLKQEKTRTQELWQLNCAKLTELDAALLENRRRDLSVEKLLARGDGNRKAKSGISNDRVVTRCSYLVVQ